MWTNSTITEQRVFVCRLWFLRDASLRANQSPAEEVNTNALPTWTRRSWVWIPAPLCRVCVISPVFPSVCVGLMFLPLPPSKALSCWCRGFVSPVWRFSSHRYLCVSQVKNWTWPPALLWSWPTGSDWSRLVLVPGRADARWTSLPCGSGWSGWRERCRRSGRNVEEQKEAAAPPKRAKVRATDHHLPARSPDVINDPMRFINKQLPKPFNPLD